MRKFRHLIGEEDCYQPQRRTIMNRSMIGHVSFGVATTKAYPALGFGQLSDPRALEQIHMNYLESNRRKKKKLRNTHTLRTTFPALGAEISRQGLTRLIPFLCYICIRRTHSRKELEFDFGDQFILYLV